MLHVLATMFMLHVTVGTYNVIVGAVCCYVECGDNVGVIFGVM